MGLAQQRSRDAAAASSGMERVRVADSEAEHHEFADSLGWLAERQSKGSGAREHP